MQVSIQGDKYASAQVLAKVAYASAQVSKCLGKCVPVSRGGRGKFEHRGNPQPAGNSELRALGELKIKLMMYLSPKSLFLPKFISYSFFVLLLIQIRDFRLILCYLGIFFLNTL